MYVDNCAAQRRRGPACGRQSKLRILTKGRTLIISTSLYHRPLSIPDECSDSKLTFFSFFYFFLNRIDAEMLHDSVLHGVSQCQ